MKLSLVPVIWAAVTASLMCFACTKASKPLAQLPDSPEEFYLAYMLAELRGVESEIRPLILPHKHADILWKYSLPVEVAEPRAEMYRSMPIFRVGPEDGGRVMLRSFATQYALASVKTDGGWKLDASPIIEDRTRRDPSYWVEPSRP